MAAAFHAGNNNSQTSGSASFSIVNTITAGDSVIFFGSWDSSSTVTPTVATTGGTGSDSFSLIYGPFTNGVFKYGGWLLPSAGTGRTGCIISWASSNPSFADGFCLSFTGLTSPALDQTAFANGNGTAVSSGNTPTLTSTDEFCVSYGASASSLSSVNSPWTALPLIGDTGSGCGYQVVTATTPVASSFTNNSGNWISYVLTFKSGGGPVDVLASQIWL